MVLVGQILHLIINPLPTLNSSDEFSVYSRPALAPRAAGDGALATGAAGGIDPTIPAPAGCRIDVDRAPSPSPRGSQGVYARYTGVPCRQTEARRSVATRPQRRGVVRVHSRLDPDGQTRTRVASLTPTVLTSVLLDGDTIHAETCQTSTRDEGECAGPHDYPRWACRTPRRAPVAPGYHQTW